MQKLKIVRARWMSFRLFRLALSQYPGSKYGLTQMTEEMLANHDTVLAARVNNGTVEYLLNLDWSPWRRY
jgi:hypothetical protein